jgi:hypothetical protein
MQDHIRMDTFCKDRFPGLYCLLMTFFREWRIRNPAYLIFDIPL